MNNLRQGWLSPTGEFFECNSYDHYETAKELAEAIFVPSINPKMHRVISDDERLLNAGWVYIGISSFMCHEWRISWNRKLTPEQISFLRPYFENENELPVNEFCRTLWNEELNSV
jgi:hypothetical protein